MYVLASHVSSVLIPLSLTQRKDYFFQFNSKSPFHLYLIYLNGETHDELNWELCKYSCYVLTSSMNGQEKEPAQVARDPLWIKNRFRRVQEEQTENLVIQRPSLNSENMEGAIQKCLHFQTYWILFFSHFFSFVCTRTHTGLFFSRQDLEHVARESKSLWYNSNGVNRTWIGALGLENAVWEQCQWAERILGVPFSLSLICMESEGWASVKYACYLQGCVSCTETNHTVKKREYACSQRL